jgi:hypothetical protein
MGLRLLSSRAPWGPLDSSSSLLVASRAASDLVGLAGGALSGVVATSKIEYSTVSGLDSCFYSSETNVVFTIIDGLLH